MCPAGEYAGPDAAAANANAAGGNAPRDPGRDVTPYSKPHCKNDATNACDARRTQRNSPAGRTSDRHNSRSNSLGADPRAASTLGSEPSGWSEPTGWSGQTGWSPSHAGVADSDGSAGVAARDRPRWRGNNGSPSRNANVRPPDDTRRCNNGLGDARAQTAARIP
jgi:hypothetical protein